jgi:tryptophan-rich sensory protein
MMSRLRETLCFMAWLLIPFSAASVGMWFDPGQWYADLVKPAWTPPGYVFAPVWTVLYAMMGLAAWMVWRREGFRGGRAALALFFAQLVLNGMWTWLFFGLHRPLLAFVELIVLWLAILMTLVAFCRIRRAAGILLIPYLGWVTFAAALNWQIWRLNHG